ncbi:MAG: ABC transporter permease [Synergistaceae bacterium]|jgi:putative ABC transport system permease protein|nr:ABC transporter permease [Synergistaceae bacterium]
MKCGKTPLSFRGIAWCNLKRRPFRTVCLISLVAVLACVLFGGSAIIGSVVSGTDGLSKRLGADILILPSGYDKTIEGILLRGEPSTFFMEREWAEKIYEVEGVIAASPQLMVASFNASCCSIPAQIIGIEQDTDFIVEPWIRTSLPGRLSDGDIVVGGAVSGKPGGRLNFFGREYRIAAKMENTGTGFDGSIFMDMDSARRAARDRSEMTGDPPPPGGAISSVAVLTDGRFTPNAMADRIYSRFGYGKSGIAVVPAKEIIGNVSGGLRTLAGFVTAFAAVLWLLCVLALSVVFSVMTNERKREFGILRSLGITRKKLASLVVLESAAISAAGGLTGIFLSALLILPFRVYIKTTISMPYMHMPPAQMLAAAAGSLAVSFAAGMLASLCSSARICARETYGVIREGDA